MSFLGLRGSNLRSTGEAPNKRKDSFWTDFPLNPNATKELRLGQPAEEALKRSEGYYRDRHFEEASAEADKAISMAQYWQGGLFIEKARQMKARALIELNKFQEAIPLLEKDHHPAKSNSLDLDLALCYVKVGVPTKVRQHFSDQMILACDERLLSSDLPGTASGESLEASIRLARGLELLTTAEPEAARREFAYAEQLAPKNAMAPFYGGLSLWYLEKRDLAQPYFKRADSLANGRFKQDMQHYIFD